MPHKAGMGAIFGIVSENGVAKSGSPVYLMDMRRDLGVGQAKILLKKTTKPDGGFVFNGLDPNYTDYSIMASDEDGLIPKNALIQDRVQPIPTTAGLGALADWYTRILKDGATAGFVGIHTTGSPPTPLGIVGSVLYTGTPSEQGVSMGVPELPSLSSLNTHKSGSISTYGRSLGEPSKSVSFEVVIDLDSFREDSLDLAIAFGASVNVTDSRSAGDVINIGSGVATSTNGYINTELIYNPKTKGIYIRGFYGGYTDRAAISPIVYLTSYTGVVHVVVTFDFSKLVSVYINGALIGSDTSTFTQPFYLEKGANFMIVGGQTNSKTDFYRGGVYNIGLAVGYPLALTSEQVMSHYKSLYSNDLAPLTTGYAREVMASLPSWYYRLNEISVLKGMSGELEARAGDSNLSPPRSLLKFNDPTVVQTMVDSPILGFNTFSKTRYGTLSGPNAGLFGFTFTNQFSFSCWARFAAATPEVPEDIVFFKSYAEKVDPFFQLRRNTNGKMTAVVKGYTGVEVFNFNYSPPAEVWVSMWVVMDKRVKPNPLLKLYVGTESGEITLMESMTANSVDLYTPAAEIGQPYPTRFGLQVSVGNSMTGSLCELAMFHNAISEDAIKEIWASKDTP